MLHVWRPSGQELAVVSAEDFKDAVALKEHLRELHGFPVSLQQLLHEGNVLDDGAELDATTDLQLVLLSLSGLSQQDGRARLAVAELTTAAQSNRDTVVRRLLESCVDTDGRHADGSTALMLASESGHLEVVRLLLAAGAETEWADPMGRTALIRASQSGHAEVARFLLEAGADKDGRQRDGSTALMLASESGHLEVVRLLLAAQARTAIAGSRGKTALMLASSKGHLEVVRLLLEPGSETDYDAYFGSHVALMLASGSGHVEVVHLLLEFGAKTDCADPVGKTALMLAAQNGHAEVAHLLMEAAAEKDSVDQFGNTALMLASGLTAVGFASQSGVLEVARLLLEAGADKDCWNHSGMTALMLASESGCWEVARLLLEHGADKDCWDGAGMTALMRWGSFRKVRPRRPSARRLGQCETSCGRLRRPPSNTIGPSPWSSWRSTKEMKVLLQLLGGDRYDGSCARQFRQEEFNEARPEPPTGEQLMACFNAQMTSMGMGCCGRERSIDGFAFLTGAKDAFNHHPCDELERTRAFQDYDRSLIRQHCFEDGMFMVHSKDVKFAKESARRVSDLTKPRGEL